MESKWILQFLKISMKSLNIPEIYVFYSKFLKKFYPLTSGRKWVDLFYRYLFIEQSANKLYSATKTGNVFIYGELEFAKSSLYSYQIYRQKKGHSNPIHSSFFGNRSIFKRFLGFLTKYDLRRYSILSEFELII